MKYIQLSDNENRCIKWYINYNSKTVLSIFCDVDFDFINLEMILVCGTRFLSRQKTGKLIDKSSNWAINPVMTTTSIIAFAVTAFFIIIVPGPTVTVIIANSLRDGARAGLANIAGTNLGLAIMITIVAFGLDSVVALMGQAFFWVKLAGAAYLVWLGIKMLRTDGSIGSADDAGGEKPKRPAKGYFWQGFIVILSNPKVLLLFGAFLPPFINPAVDPFWQVMTLGAIFMMIATICDSAYAFLAGGAGKMLTRNRVKLVERISGTVLIGGGVWLATLRKA